MSKRYNKYNKLNESLPRQTTVDQLKRIRDEINRSQDIQVGPEHTHMSGDVGDRVIDDLVKHKGKQEMNNLFWWDNPLDRHIDSYETFVRDDNKKSLGYTRDSKERSERGTDIPDMPISEVPKEKRSLSSNSITGKNILENMKHVIKYDDLLNEGFGKGFINKAMEFIGKIKDLFEGIKLPESEVREVFDSPRLSIAVVRNPGYYRQIKDICNANEERVTRAYDEVFGIREEISLTSILVSVAVCFFIYYAIQKGWADKVIRKFDPNFRGQEGYPGDDWRRAKPKPNPRKEIPRKAYRTKQEEIDAILDKVNRVGYNGLSAAEKETLRNK
jgi:hypothetical protein